MGSQQEENLSFHQSSSSARHTPAASPIPPTYHDFNNNTFSETTNYDQLNSSTGSQQQLFNNQFDFAAVNASLFSDNLSGDSSVLNLSQGNSQSFPDFINFDGSTGLTDTSYDGPLFAPSADQSFNSDLVDPSLLDPQMSPHSMLGPMATSVTPLPAHLLAPNNMQHHSSSPHGSPSLQNTQYDSSPRNHSRHTSLDPSSAQFPQGQMGSWGDSAQFQGHRRTLSDAHSEISSAHASPYMQAADDFNQPSHSPGLHPQDPAMFEDVMGIGGVSLSQASPSYMTPSHSPHVSPSISPNHQADNTFPTMDNYNMIPSMGASMNQFDPSVMQGVSLQGPTIDYTNMSNTPPNQENINRSDAISPPEISIQFAPPSRQASFEPQNQKTTANADALSLPEKQSRGRAKSDPFSSRSSTPAKDLLSPHAAGVGSRSPSPSGTGKSRRSSTSSVPHRDYILDLADPTRPTSAGSNEASTGTKRTQKHPANFQCNLCPKRFTRAYNLRSHLRTHTDERPFVCSHCGKAFARQHDRKRHEGLHSGEKKFVCRGNLKDGNNWGCGRRFARADALGRHFRSEAGRVCIKSLMDEEARERNLQNPEPGSELGINIMPMPNQGIMGMAQPQTGFAYGISDPGVFQGGMAVPQMPMRLPTALLQQYPTLQGIWDSLPANGPDELDDGVGHGTYDASSAGEFEEDEKWQNYQGSAQGWASDVGP